MIAFTNPLSALPPRAVARHLSDSLQTTPTGPIPPAGEAFLDYFRCPLPDDVAGARSGSRSEERVLVNVTEAVTNLRLEQYVRHPRPRSERLASLPLVRRSYYLVRPLLPISIRKHLQRVSLNGWRRIPFPRWPVDTTVESLMEHVMGQLLTNCGLREIPFIWFWPDGAPSCVMMTHDVEAPAGRDFCDRLMDVDEEYGFESSIQVIPEGRYMHADTLVERVRERGFEPNIHDLNHDGHLFDEEAGFLCRAAQINEYVRRFRTHGFRAGAMYRKQEWFAALDISYDMSVPNVAHLDPQRGGCCTVMPYFIGDIIELPLTTIQDYSLFNILRDYSITLWLEQMKLIMARNGLISFNTHPDYLLTPRALGLYCQLLEHLALLRDRRRVWVAAAGEVERWWRGRSGMRLVRNGEAWQIVGEGCDRARLAYATLADAHVTYRIATDS